jgi:hypothetical protein
MTNTAVTKLEKLLDLALTKSSVIRAEQGKRGKQSSWMLTEIHRLFPSMTGCHSASMCVQQLVAKYIKTTKLITRILPKVRDVLNMMTSSKHTV